MRMSELKRYLAIEMHYMDRSKAGMRLLDVN